MYRQPRFMTAEEAITRWQLEPLPDEGGYYRRLHLSEESITLKDGRERSLSSAILFLITAESFSALHRLKVAESYHFHHGDALELLQMAPDGRCERLVLGLECPFALVPPGTWQGSRLAEGFECGYALVSTVCTPGFSWEDFELGERARLLVNYPDEHAAIHALTRES